MWPAELDMDLPSDVSPWEDGPLHRCYPFSFSFQLPPPSVVLARGCRTLKLACTQFVRVTDYSLAALTFVSTARILLLCRSANIRVCFLCSFRLTAQSAGNRLCSIFIQVDG